MWLRLLTSLDFSMSEMNNLIWFLKLWFFSFKFYSPWIIFIRIRFWLKGFFEKITMFLKIMLWIIVKFYRYSLSFDLTLFRSIFLISRDDKRKNWNFCKFLDCLINYFKIISLKRLNTYLVSLNILQIINKEIPNPHK